MLLLFDKGLSDHPMSEATGAYSMLQVKKCFIDKFGEDPKMVFSAPGRVNLVRSLALLCATLRVSVKDTPAHILKSVGPF